MKPSRSNPLALLGLLTAIWVSPAAAAQVDPSPALPTPLRSQKPVNSSEGAEFLLLPTGARSVAMGGAVTAQRGAYEAVLWNTAGLAGMQQRRLFFSHAETAFDTRSDVLAILWPTSGIGTFGVTYYLVDFGDLASTGPDGAVLGNISFRNQEFLLSFARRLIGPLEAGVSYKLIQLIFRCEGACPGQQSFTRSTHALDLGLIYDRPVGIPITLGGSLRHLGLPLEGRADDDPLPTRVRIGMVYEALSAFTADSVFALAVAVDLEDEWRDIGGPGVLVGSEFGVASSFFLRAGYAFNDSGSGGPTLGLGLTRDWFYLDLSRGFDDLSAATGEESVQVNFGVIF